MARVSVEQKALTDSRFTHLGVILTDGENINGSLYAAIGIGVMVHVWNECQERHALSLSHVTLDCIGFHLGLKDHQGLGQSIVKSDLGEDQDGGMVRIKGAEGRVEWLAQSRESARERQKKHRERNALVTRDGVTNVTLVTPSLTLTPALTQSQNSETTLAPPLKTAEPPILVFPTNGKPPEWHLTSEQVREWSSLYAGVDVVVECQKALAWVGANNRKTAKGMPKFLVGWLNRANDRPSRSMAKVIQSAEDSAKLDRWERGED